MTNGTKALFMLKIRIPLEGTAPPTDSSRQGQDFRPYYGKKLSSPNLEYPYRVPHSKIKIKK